MNELRNELVYERDVHGSVIDSNKYAPDTVVEIITWLSEKLESIPSEYRNYATFEIDSVGGYEGEHHAEIKIAYMRPETDDEMQLRVSKDRATIETRLRQHEQQAAALRAALGR